MNYTLLLFKSINRSMVMRFELPLTKSEMQWLVEVVTRYRLITFNGLGYDLPLLVLVLNGYSSARIKAASDRIIVHNLKPWNFEQEFGVNVTPEEIDHVDLMEVAPLTGGLKLYGGRLHSRSLQDLPIPPSKVVTEEDKVVLRSYCENDCDTLTDLFHALKVQLGLREEMSTQYGLDLRSKSDAQIAEAVIKKECETLLKKRLDKPSHAPGSRFQYQIPAWMRFTSLDILGSIREAEFVVTDAGGVMMPPALEKRKVTLGKGIYRLGVGGLHSSETRQVVKEDADHMLMDFDVASYYPAIALNQGLYPKHIGPTFLTVYQGLVNRRLAAKKAGQKTISESLKITINGTFGKLGSKWSVLYSPDLMVQVTVTGQLALLMLIESLVDVIGVEVVSANTDGVTIRCRRDTEQEAVDAVRAWETITGFETERADYLGLYSRDVNNYIAIKTNGEVKTKGAYGTGLPLHKNPYASICSRAVIEFLKSGTPITQSVGVCQDIRQFLCIRTVKGGATHHGRPIGKIARWYYSTQEEEALLYAVNQHLVPDTYGARPCVMLPTEMPEDLDREWYIRTANEMLADLGVAV